MAIYAGSINRDYVYMPIGILPHISVSLAAQYLKEKSPQDEAVMHLMSSGHFRTRPGQLHLVFQLRNEWYGYSQLGKKVIALKGHGFSRADFKANIVGFIR